MKHLLSLTLATFVAASLAGCVAASRSNDYTFARASGGPDCRRFAQPGDPKIQIYCKNSQVSKIWPIAPATYAAQVPADKSCRRISKSVSAGLRTYCDTAAYWDDFDARAIKAGVTCRWLGYSHALGRAPQEVCMDGHQWTRAETNAVLARGVSTGGSSWGGNNSSGSTAPYATSYGPFPAGGAIGQ